MAQQAQNIIKAIDQMITSTPDVETLRESISRSGSLSNKSNNTTTQDSSSMAKSVVHSQQQPPAASVFQSTDPYVLTQAQNSNQSQQQIQNLTTAPAPSVVQPVTSTQPYQSSMLKSTPELAKPANQTASQENFQTPQALSIQNPTRSQSPNTAAQKAIENNIIHRFSTELAPRLIQEIANNIKKDLQRPSFSNQVATMPSNISQYSADNNTSMLGNRSQLSQIEQQNQHLRIKQIKRNISNIRSKMAAPWLTKDECYDIVTEIFKYRK